MLTSTEDGRISEPHIRTEPDESSQTLESRGGEELDDEEEDLSSEMEDDVGCPLESTLLYHMEKKYMRDELESIVNSGSAASAEMSDSIIDMFGTSPCWLASRRGLELVVLDHNTISRVGDASKFASHAKHITQLDLGWNQLGSWGEIANLLSSLPSLRVLNLQHNPVEPVIKWRVGKKRRFSGGRGGAQRRAKAKTPNVTTPILPLPISSRLTVLILNGVQLPVATLRHFLATMPSLNELHLSGNRALLLSESVGGGEDEDDVLVSASVTHLYLNDIGASEWRLLASTIASLFPSTSHLSVVDNPLQRVEPYDANGLALKSLNASRTHLADWASVEAMEGVEELRLRHVALLEPHDDEERFNLTVARISSLRSLNGSLITAQQREESERFFIRYYSPGAHPSPPSAPPPAYERLVAKHGQLGPLVKVDFTPKRTAQVWVRYQTLRDYDGGEGSSANNGEKREQARLRLSSTVQQLMSYAARVSGIPTSRMRIFYYNAASSAVVDGGCGPTELRLPQQKLHSLHVEDGDEFFVQEKLPTMTPTKSQPRRVPSRRS